MASAGRPPPRPPLRQLAIPYRHIPAVMERNAISERSEYHLFE